MTPALETGTVADAMHAGIVSCPADASATSVAEAMANQRVHCVFVMHEAQGNAQRPYVWGIVSDLDLMRAALRGVETETAGSLATQPMITVKPTMPVRDAAALMVEHGVSHLVVVGSDTLEPIGVLSTTDLAGILARGGR